MNSCASVQIVSLTVGIVFVASAEISVFDLLILELQLRGSNSPYLVASDAINDISFQFGYMRGGKVLQASGNYLLKTFKKVEIKSNELAVSHA